MEERGRDSLCGQQHVFPCVQLVGVGVLPVQVLAHSFGGKLRLTDVAEVSGQVDRLTWGQEHSDTQELGVHELWVDLFAWHQLLQNDAARKVKRVHFDLFC